MVELPDKANEDLPRSDGTTRLTLLVRTTVIGVPRADLVFRLRRPVLSVCGKGNRSGDEDKDGSKRSLDRHHQAPLFRMPCAKTSAGP